MTLKKILCGGAAALVPLCLAAMPAAATETHGYVISWFATATNLDKVDFKTNCPEGRNGGRTDWTIRDLQAIGYTKAQAQEIVKNAPNSTELPPDISKRIETRAVVNGRHVSIYNYPDAVTDPNIETVTGKVAYGFDLGGKNEAAKFEDPETHEKVDNQLWRAVGCTESFHAVPPVMPYPEELSWNLMIDSAPAWIVQVTGDDLSKDGKVTITLDRATQHLDRDSTGGVMSNASYVIDQSPRSHNVLQGEIKNGVISITPKSVYLQGEMPYYSEINIRNAHMRLKPQTDGNLVGYWGGYINWTTFIYMYTSRPGNGSDSVGLYHAVKKMADAMPDPKTGQNQEISTTFRMVAVPAYIGTLDGKIVAVPSTNPTPGKVAAK